MHKEECLDTRNGPVRDFLFNRWNFPGVEASPDGEERMQMEGHDYRMYPKMEEGTKGKGWDIRGWQRE